MVLLGLLASMGLGDRVELGLCGENVVGSERGGAPLLGRYHVLCVDRWFLDAGEG